MMLYCLIARFFYFHSTMGQIHILYQALGFAIKMFQIHRQNVLQNV